jgi:arylsulfatase A-like enzyme
MMMFVGFPGPHDPWDPPKEWYAKYEGAAMDEAKGITEPGSWVPEVAAEHQRKLQKIHPDMTPEVVAKTRALYYAKISHIDDWVGKIVESLKKKKMWEDTVLIFWSDHGEMLWDKGRLHKAVMYEESVRVPLVIRTAETAKRGGKVARGLVSLMDVWPTILELAGCEAKKGTFRKSLAPVLERPEMVLNEAVFSEIGEGENPVGVPSEGRRTMIRDERYKMVVNREGEVLKLYDLVEDTEEEVNLVGKKGMEEVVAGLRERMLKWLLETGNGQVGE